MIRLSRPVLCESELTVTADISQLIELQVSRDSKSPGMPHFPPYPPFTFPNSRILFRSHPATSCGVLRQHCEVVFRFTPVHGTLFLCSFLTLPTPVHIPPYAIRPTWKSGAGLCNLGSGMAGSRRAIMLPNRWQCPDFLKYWLRRATASQGVGKLVFTT